MNNQCNMELPFRKVACDQLTDLDQGAISLSVPTLEDVILIHSYEENDAINKLDVVVVEPGSEICLARHDGTPLQVYDADPYQETNLFTEPIDRFRLCKDEAGFWIAMIASKDVLSRSGVVDFIDIVAMYALNKQTKNIAISAGR